MARTEPLFDTLYARLLSEETKKKSERIIVTVAIVSYLIHLGLVALVDLDVLLPNNTSRLLSNPIVAIYTPFSFILIYEVYLLVYYFPKSISNYIGKQYEIITLIVIRRTFSELSNLKFTQNWFTESSDLQFTYDLLATIILFLLIFVFYRLNEQEEQQDKTRSSTLQATRFIAIKKGIAMLLVPTVLVLSIYSLGHWIYENFFSITQMVGSIKDINKIFFDEFFTILILTDVLLLLLSFLLTDRFNMVIRNSAFIISTILIKLSFATEGLLNSILVVMAVGFGVIILTIYNQYERLEKPVDV